MTKVIEVRLPEYNVKKKPDYVKLGRKVDRIMEKSFNDGKYILRAISTDEHPQLSLNELAQTVIKTGTDKYEHGRKGAAHKEFSGYDYDIQAGKILIKSGKLQLPKSNKHRTEFGDIIWHFYEHAPHDRRYSVRIDLLLIYDSSKLKKARKFHPKARSLRKGLNRYLYKFKNPENKREALLGIVKILR